MSDFDDDLVLNIADQKQINQQKSDRKTKKLEKLAQKIATGKVLKKSSKNLKEKNSKKKVYTIYLTVFSYLQDHVLVRK